MNERASHLELDSHFKFGDNWAGYAELITEDRIDHAESALKRLLGTSLVGERFLDIGCGSGLHSLAALRLGASEVVAIDIDPKSVATTRATLSKFAPNGPWRAEVISVFDLDSDKIGTFQNIYSWGVLHHTGDMRRALKATISLLGPNGLLAIAIYRETLLCPLWEMEKRFYSKTGPRSQAWIRGIYVAMIRASLWIRLKSFRRYLNDYHSQRGMDFFTDVHDWLGGWPYESISERDLLKFTHDLGLVCSRSNVLRRRHIGVFGSGCDEYVFCLSR